MRAPSPDGDTAAAPRHAARLDAALRALHGGPQVAELSDLHQAAADHVTDPAERRFHLTHAWVYALVAGNTARADALERILTELGGL